MYKYCQNISTILGELPKVWLLYEVYKSCQNCTILLYHNNISRALPENNFENSLTQGSKQSIIEEVPNKFGSINTFKTTLTLQL